MPSRCGDGAPTPFALSLVALLCVTACRDPDPPVPRGDLSLIDRARDSDEGDEPGEESCRNKRTFYRDRDGDGFGDPRAPVQACTAPPGFVTDKRDCYDRNRRARPGQRDYFAVHRGDGSFDYDCDGEQTRRHTARAYCRVREGGGGCALASGWVGRRSIPKCGEPAEFAWYVCKEKRVVKQPRPRPRPAVTAPTAGEAMAPPADASGGAGGTPPPPAPAPPRPRLAPGELPTQPPSPGALVPGAEQKKIFRCAGRKLPWKKRQLCR